MSKKNQAPFPVRNKTIMSYGGTNLIERAYRAPASFSKNLCCVLYPLHTSVPKFRFAHENFVGAPSVVRCCCLRLRLIDI